MPSGVITRTWSFEPARRRGTRRSLLLGAAGAVGAAALGVGPSRAQGATPPPATGLDIERARAEGKVVLYTSLDTQIVDAIIAPFTENYGIEVEYARQGSAETIAKVLAEADAGGVRADVIDASEVNGFRLLKERELLAPYRFAGAETVAAELRDADDTWVADRLTQGVIQFNTSEIAAESVPRSWQDLTAPEFAGRLAFHGRSDGEAAPRLHLLAQAFGWELLEGLAANEPLRVETPQVATQILENGERAVAFNQNDNLAWRSKLEGKATDYIFPAEGVPSEAGAVGIAAQAAHPTAGRLFYEWWLRDEGQRLLVAGGKYSSRTDIAPPEGSPPLAELRLLPFDPVAYGAERDGIHERMAEIFGGEWGV